MKRNLTITLILIMAPLVGLSQVVTEGGLTVITYPPGAQVTLEGDATVVGISPATFAYPLLGEFKLMVSKPGFEKYKTRLLLDPSYTRQVDVTLSPRTGFKAALRSLVIPGWGQFYMERKTRGAVFVSLLAGSAIATMVLDNRFRDKEDIYLERLAEYDAAVALGRPIDELARRHGSLAAAQQDAFDAEDKRLVAAKVTLGIWALNVLDALLLSSGERTTFEVKGLAVEPTTNNGTLGISLTKAF